MDTYFTKIVNLVRMGVDMKTFFSIVLFLCFLPTYSQVRDSLFIYPGNKIAIEGNKILLNGRTSNFNSHLELLYFDGEQWNNFSKDSLPFSFTKDCYFTPSKFSDHIYLSTIKHLWEYDGMKWTPYSIKDSLDGIRNFDEIIELPDSSLVLFSTHYVKRFDSTSSDSVIINYKELQTFKNGKFTTLKSIQFDIKSIHFYSKYMYGLKKHINGSYSFTAYNLNPQKGGHEILTFSTDGQLLRSDRYPDLTPFGYNKTGISFRDYLFDSKGSLWFCTYHLDQKNDLYLGMVEIRENGNIFLYNKNILNKEYNHNHNTFDIDEEDNIWFDYIYRGEEQPDGFKALYTSIFKLQSDRTTIKEYLYEEVRDNSTYYIGEFSDNIPIYYMYPITLIKYRRTENSLLIFSDVPLLEFFPDKVPSSVYKKGLQPIQLYPNPVLSGNTITIESRTFEKVNNPLFVVIRDISGATVRENIISAIGNLVSIKTEGLSRGTYFVSVLNNNKIILQTSFVKE